ncbi:TPA_asm: M [Silene gammacytorhabdovirus 1]|nr:TPA_asm: M [Silene gammacytorhabdovirus 1]
MDSTNPFYFRLPANSGIRPVLSDSLDDFYHVYLSFSGYIKVIGETESGMEELYALTCAEANNNNWSPIMKDSIELIIWAVSQNPEFVLNRRIESSPFFGPHAIVKELIPQSQFIVLTKRSAFEEIPTNIILSGNNKWTTSGMEWIMEIQMNGVVKRLSELEKLTASRNQLSQYIKADQFSPYNSMSSCNISNSESESSTSMVSERSSDE